MYRSVVNQLIEWKESDERKPLIVLGARQVGKTYSLLDFGKQHYKYVAYINCDENEQAKNLFVQDYNMERVLFAIAAIAGVPVVPGDTLIILDEIQELQKGLASLKYFLRMLLNIMYVLLARCLASRCGTVSRFLLGRSI